MNEEYKEGKYCRVAVCNIVGVKDEDRWAFQTSHGDVDSRLNDFSSFSVFDGHASNVVAEYLSKRLEINIARALASRMLTAEGLAQAPIDDMVAAKVPRSGPALLRTTSNMSAASSEEESGTDTDRNNTDVDVDQIGYDLEPPKPSSSSPLSSTLVGEKDSVLQKARSLSVQSSSGSGLHLMTDSNKFDAILCDAINTEVQRIDKNVRNKTSAGSTYCGLFLRKQSNGQVRAFCANVGDSRCLMVSVDTQFMRPVDATKDDEADLNDSTHNSSVWDSEHMNDRQKEFQLLVRNNSKVGMSSIEENSPFTARRKESIEKMIEIPSSAKLQERAGGVRRNDSIIQFRSPLSDTELNDALALSNHSERSMPKSDSDVSETMPVQDTVDASTPLSEAPPGALGWGGRAPETGINRLTAVVHMMSEDHSLINTRERQRIENRKLNFRYDIPAEACIISPPGMIPDFLRHFEGDQVVRRSSEIMTPSPDAHKEEEGKKGTLSPQAQTTPSSDEGEAPEASRQRKTCFDLYLFEALRSGSPTRKLIKTSVAYIEKLKMLAERDRDTPSPLFDASLRLTIPKDYPESAIESPVATRKSMSLPVDNLRLDDDIHATHVIKTTTPDSNQSSATSPSGSSPRGAVAVLDGSNADDLPIDPDLICPQQTYKHSFISRRVSVDGRTVGPEAIFGRFNMSIMMTRSVGDKFGPRSCIAVPEIAAKTIQKKQFVRFILASDGFWDVASFETIRKTAMKKKHRDPRVLARHLADKGKRYRFKKNMRADDITVMVVDVNADEITTVDGSDGVETVRVERGPDGRYREMKQDACVPGACVLS